jgi:hypothetical protein
LASLCSLPYLFGIPCFCSKYLVGIPMLASILVWHPYARRTCLAAMSAWAAMPRMQVLLCQKTAVVSMPEECYHCPYYSSIIGILH